MPVFQDLPQELILMILKETTIDVVLELSVLSRTFYLATRMYLAYNHSITVTDKYTLEVPGGIGYTTEASVLFKTICKFPILGRSIVNITAYVHEDESPAPPPENTNTITSELNPLEAPKQYASFLSAWILCPNLMSLSINIQQPPFINEAEDLGTQAFNRLRTVSFGWSRVDEGHAEQAENVKHVRSLISSQTQPHAPLLDLDRDHASQLLRTEESLPSSVVSGVFDRWPSLWSPSVKLSAMSLFWPELLGTRIGITMTRLHIDMNIIGYYKQESHSRAFYVMRPISDVLSQTCSSLEVLQVNYQLVPPVDRINLIWEFHILFAKDVFKGVANMKNLHTMFIPCSWWDFHNNRGRLSNEVHASCIPESLLRLVLLKCVTDALGLTLERLRMVLVDTITTDEEETAIVSPKLIELRGEEHALSDFGGMSSSWLSAAADLQRTVRGRGIELKVFQSGIEIGLEEYWQSQAMYPIKVQPKNNDK